jgi:hypothetical protein
VQPVQLSLMPEQVPAPAATLIAQLPEPQVAAAVALLAHLIVKTTRPTSLSIVDVEVVGE